MPNIISWGDYFQTEMASSLVDLTDEQFKKAVSTVKFDMISCHHIFSEKEDSFFKWVDDTYYELMAREIEIFTEEEEDIIHLKILKEYYVDLSVVDNFTETEVSWYSEFSEAVAI